MLGTIEYHNGVDCSPSLMTTPDSKTLAQWLAATERSQRRVAWLALDPGDADLRQFLTHLVAAIRTGDFEAAANTLGLAYRAGPQVAESAVRKTFFGQVTDLRWTSYRSEPAGATRRVVLEGEAVHGNDLWQTFAVEMSRDGDEWKLGGIRISGPVWK